MEKYRAIKKNCIYIYKRFNFIPDEILMQFDKYNFELIKAHIPLETGFASANSRIANATRKMLHKQHEIYMKYTWPTPEDPTPPIFH